MLDELTGIGRQLVEATDADRKLAHCPRIGQHHRNNCHGPRDAPRGGLGHDADPDIALDQPAHRIEAAQLHAQSQRLTDTHGFIREETLQRAGAIQPDEVVVEHIREPDRRALGERMVARDDQHETVFAEGKGLQRARIDGGSDDAEVGDAFSDKTYDLVAEPLLEIDADVGVCGQE